MKQEFECIDALHFSVLLLACCWNLEISILSKKVPKVLPNELMLDVENLLLQLLKQEFECIHVCCQGKKN